MNPDIATNVFKYVKGREASKMRSLGLKDLKGKHPKKIKGDVKGGPWLQGLPYLTPDYNTKRLSPAVQDQITNSDVATMKELQRELRNIM